MTSVGRSYAGLSPQQRSQNRRERLLGAARALIAEHGVAALTVDVVCQRANLSKRYFYDHFATKDDLLDTCAEDLFTRLWAGVDDVLTAAPLAFKVQGALTVVIHTLKSDAADARLYMECPGFPRLRERQLRAVREFSEQIALRGVRFAGTPKPSVDRVLATRALVAGTTDLIVAWLHGEIDTDEGVLIATLTAAARGAASTL